MKLIDELGEEKRQVGLGFPASEGRLARLSREYIQRELGHLPEAARKKIVCDNAAKLYRFVN